MLESVLDVLACPDCPPSRLARAQVLSDDLATNALAATLPFAVTGALIAWIRRRLDRQGDHETVHEGDHPGDGRGDQGGAP